VRNGYRELANRYPERFRVLDATAGIEDLHRQVLKELGKDLGFRI
jgi:thymidylate kinase